MRPRKRRSRSYFRPSLDLSTSYLGLKLSSPLVVGASPFADDTHVAMQLQDAGAGALVMRSLFAEQIYLDALTRAPQPASSLAPGDQGVPIFPKLSEYQLNPDQYLRQIADLKAALVIPIIASLNGCRPGGWIDYARRFESAGADAVELNLYQIFTDPELSAEEVEGELLETVRLLKSTVRIPIAVKIHPYYTALVNFVRQLERAGANGVIVFNRLYQSEFDVDEQVPLTQLRLSASAELVLRLRWLTLLAPGAGCSLAITGGVQNANDALKAILTGADAVQLVSVLLANGPRFLTTIADGLRLWMARHDYHSVDQFRGKMNRHGLADASAIERAEYQRILQVWQI